MTRELFRAALKQRGITMEAFAHQHQLDPASVAKWGTQRNGRLQRFPAWVDARLGPNDPGEASDG